MIPTCPTCNKKPAYIGAGTQPPGECETCREGNLRGLSKPANFGGALLFEIGKLLHASSLIHLKGGPLGDRYYIIPVRDELRIFAEGFAYNPFDAITIDRSGKQLLGHH